MRTSGALALSALLLVSCGDDPAGPVTEIVVYVDADDAVRGRASNIQVVVSGRAADGSEFTPAEGGALDVSPSRLPFQFSFAPLDGDTSRQWEVTVRGESAGGVFIEKIARGVYVPDQSRVLYMVLRNDCSEMLSCAADQTCEGGACTSNIRPPDSLPLYEGGRVPAPPDMVCDGPADCDDGRFCNGSERCEPGSPAASPRGCVPGDRPCPMSDSCDEASELCMTGGCEDPDEDGDGFARPACAGDDCDDRNPDKFPGNPEVDDGIDNDCDGTVDEGLMMCPMGLEGDASSCMDGCDNDSDGRTDCEESDCVSDDCLCDDTPSLERSEVACSDGCDNDHNGFTDCADWHCDGFGGCMGPNRSCAECADGQECLTRRAYGFLAACGIPCIIDEDAETATPGIQPDCPPSLACWWRGGATTDGVCAPGNPGMRPPPPEPNIGEACSDGEDCASPRGWGRCLDEVDEGFTDGYCTILDCAAPGDQPARGLCGDRAECISFDNTSYCLTRCDEGCRPGYTCASELGEGGVCVPTCELSVGCGRFGTCTGGGYCMPSTSF